MSYEQSLWGVLVLLLVGRPTKEPVDHLANPLLDFQKYAKGELHAARPCNLYFDFTSHGEHSN